MMNSLGWKGNPPISHSAPSTWCWCWSSARRGTVASWENRVTPAKCPFEAPALMGACLKHLSRLATVTTSAEGSCVHQVIPVPTLMPALPARVSTQVPSVGRDKMLSVHQKDTQTSSQTPVKSLPTPVKADKLAEWLTGYDRNKYKFLVSGFKKGFSIHSQKDCPPRIAKNHNSALQNVAVIDNKIKHDLDSKIIEGPFDHPPTKKFVCSPLGLVGKKTAPGEPPYTI